MEKAFFAAILAAWCGNEPGAPLPDDLGLDPEIAGRVLKVPGPSAVAKGWHGERRSVWDVAEAAPVAAKSCIYVPVVDDNGIVTGVVTVC